jgi:hypothetical protein
MASLGFPVRRIEERDNGKYYLYEDPERPKKEYAFWTTVHDSKLFWYSGLSRSATKIAEGFSSAGLFID